MATDNFTGGSSSGPIDWSADTAWSEGAPPAASDIAEQSGFGIVNLTNDVIDGSTGTIGPLTPVEAVEGLTLASGANLEIPSGQALADFGNGDSTFAGAGSTIEVGGSMYVESGVTTGQGTIDVDTGGLVDYYGGDFTGNVDVASGGTFIANGNSFTGTATVSGDFNLYQQDIPSSPSSSPYITLLPGGDVNVIGNDQTGTINIAAGGVVGIYAQYNGVIDNLNTSGSVSVFYGSGDVTQTATTDSISGNTVTLNFTGGVSYTVNFDSTVNFIVTPDGERFIITSSTVCFVTGARIRTARGQVAVEDLKVGDLAVTGTGEARPIIWIGQRTVRGPERALWPVRVMAGAFGEGAPVRDLYLSPGHAVCVNVLDEVFIPIGDLVNGGTIAQVKREEVTYWHVELESHDVLLAEGLRCESYLDVGNRQWFGREHGRLQAIDPGRLAEARCGRPFVSDGPIVEVVRQRLAARAEALGWCATEDIDLHLIVDGQRVDPDLDGDLARFVFPAKAKEARLVSRTFTPGSDRRSLGVRIEGLYIFSDGLRLARQVQFDELDGFHPEEIADGESWRWTDGELALPADLWEGCRGGVTLRLDFDPTPACYWIAPKRRAAEKVTKAAWGGRRLTSAG